MFSCTRHVTLKFPAVGNTTLKVCPFASGGVDTQIEPSKETPLVENTGGVPGGNAAHPKVKGARTCPAFRKVTVWISPRVDSPGDVVTGVNPNFIGKKREGLVSLILVLRSGDGAPLRLRYGRANQNCE